jgi:hypothetical protein
MKDTNTRSTDEPLDELEVFRMSAQHLIQLVEYYRGAADPRLASAVERAIKAHVAVTEALCNKAEAASMPAKTVVSEETHEVDVATEDSWVESPWEYLQIPQRTKSRLGPMPRFVPLPSKTAPEEPGD